MEVEEVEESQGSDDIIYTSKEEEKETTDEVDGVATRSWASS